MAYSSRRDSESYRKKRAWAARLLRRSGIVRALRVVGHASWIPYAVRYRVIDAIYRCEYSPTIPFSIQFSGQQYRGDLSCYQDWRVYFFGVEAEPSLLLLRSLLSKRGRGIFVDIGANVGQHSTYLARYARKIHSFEPWEPVRLALVDKIRLNGLSHISVHPVALGDADGALPFYAPLGANTGTGSFDVTHAVDRNRSIGKLPVVRGDDYFETHDINDVDVVKIDAEGWELRVLQGLRKTLARTRPYIFLEFSDTTLANVGSLSEFRRAVPERYQLSYVEFDSGRPRLSPFDATHPGDVLLSPE